ncbi:MULTISPECIES: CAF17-like 4Fe-4S cluster assembly/insertion protein YgfZ [Thiorhodovibrio]|uniref:CAF17-like 4Fe-4S cluster assembly/insertion protein YgfZ n=1 Tax=Thiorhodovibrio TaxID=61593 RepID=UPI001914D661|nr:MULTISPECIES: folate-binding protein YgfZ [Thiorhodovibrio]MBK5970418.1 folate-binding protein YgfZ [Thiorhodovibrio winogradskyi]WPL11458.1 tRNA-modifying protein YgfZ [Thiorhodovibrio litoralis]
MNDHWQSFLADFGGTVGATSKVTFPDMPAEAECALCALGELGAIDIHGAEATDFLQGQLSNDLRELSDSHAQLSSHCNAKGRMLANFRVLREGDGYRLILPREQIATLLPRLKMFVLRAQVSLSDRSDELVCLGLVGECMAAVLTERFGSLPDSDNGVVRRSDTALIRIAGPLPRWLFVGPPSAAESLWREAQTAGAARAADDLWALQDIRAGIPTIDPATRELFVPQMINLHLIDGVSFHKGCYTGQEVVARMQYLGKLKRRMYVGEVALAQPPAPGSRLDSASSQSSQGAGTVVAAQQNAAGRCELLAVAEIAAVEHADLTLADTGTPVELQPPAYGFPPEV